ncbi:MAG TPA: class I SAM-dependent methyltransferase [bacterium]|nr:class I SAM-dependent methyltransferase [bacterium]
MPADLDALFDADYLACHEAEVDEPTNDAEATRIAALLRLAPGERVLDVPCGHGRIARRLAGLGAAVVGIDRSEPFLRRARADADAAGVRIDYRRQDMHALDERGTFDAVVCWFTSFGYDPDDERLRDLLRRMRCALRPGGRLLLETLNLFSAVPNPDEALTVQQLQTGEGHIRLTDRSRYDARSGRLYVHRTIERDGRARELEWSLRLFSCPELCGWLDQAGFAQVDAFDGDGRPFELDSDRLICVARS